MYKNTNLWFLVIFVGSLIIPHRRKSLPGVVTREGSNSQEEQWGARHYWLVGCLRWWSGGLYELTTLNNPHIQTIKKLCDNLLDIALYISDIFRNNIFCVIPRIMSLILSYRYYAVNSFHNINFIYIYIYIFFYFSNRI